MLSSIFLTEEAQHCIDSLNYLLKYKSEEQVQALMSHMNELARGKGVRPQESVNTPYVNTIPVEKELDYPGDMELEHELLNIIRWNAMAMVVTANRTHDGLGGHISSFASCSSLYEVAFNHIFKGPDENGMGDLVFFQGHTSPGNYSRAFLEGRLTKEKLYHFRQELAPGGGLSSYPHPYLMPDFWQFPTVSMGLGPIMAIYQARFIRYLSARGFISHEPRVYCYIGDGECDEPETLGAITLAAREKLNHLTFIVNCNLQRLDGPVRGNGKMIQELEGVFKGAGWDVIKLIWGDLWDDLLKSEHADELIQRMEEAVDGDYQKYVVSPGSYIRHHFFSKSPILKEMVSHLTDEELKHLNRGGHDPKKIYNAYMAAINEKNAPSVILAKTVKGYGLGEAGEGKNISHQQKKLNEKELREFREKLNIPISDEDVVDAPFYRPKDSDPAIQYLKKQREKLGGYLPQRDDTFHAIDLPDPDTFTQFLEKSKQKMSTTMAVVNIMSKLLRDPKIGKRIVPIIPDEARTFGMEALFRQIGIYSSKGQLYEPVDSETLLYYKESKDGQILEEGINEAGSMCSFISAGTSQSTYKETMIPFYIYYSMFGFQRIGDLVWLAGDMKCKGFLLGATAGRTTLNGEGLQHQDGHSHIMAATVPNLMAYDPAYRYELAVIIKDGLERMYQKGEEIFYYLTVGNENYSMPEMPKGVEEGIIKGMYKVRKSKKRNSNKKIQLLGSAALLKDAIVAAERLEKEENISVDVWSVTSYKQLRSEALLARRWNMLNPTKPPRRSYLEKILEKETGTFVAVSDYMKLVPDQIAPWVPGGLFTLGTDGFGRSDTRENLRRFFEVDEASIMIASMYAMHLKDLVSAEAVADLIKRLGVDPEKVFPTYV
ncbi:MAG: pyruvate dehydrogenase (acetyl-transferring), homodimeric type [Actinobacteria bacterium]|nr:pyruvate dehydrogenase (acetyl-transferring), homodimeric type [Actinomycetota bacterium]